MLSKHYLSFYMFFSYKINTLAVLLKHKHFSLCVATSYRVKMPSVNVKQQTQQLPSEAGVNSWRQQLASTAYIKATFDGWCRQLTSTACITGLCE